MRFMHSLRSYHSKQASKCLFVCFRADVLFSCNVFSQIWHDTFARHVILPSRFLCHSVECTAARNDFEDRVLSNSESRKARERVLDGSGARLGIPSLRPLEKRRSVVFLWPSLPKWQVGLPLHFDVHTCMSRYTSAAGRTSCTLGALAKNLMLSDLRCGLGSFLLLCLLNQHRFLIAAALASDSTVRPCQLCHGNSASCKRWRSAGTRQTVGKAAGCAACGILIFDGGLHWQTFLHGLPRGTTVRVSHALRWRDGVRSRANL